MEDNVGIDNDKVTAGPGEASMLGVPDSRQHAPLSWETITDIARNETARNIRAHVAFSQDWEADSERLPATKEASDGPLRTLPFAVFLKNFVCANGASARLRFRIVMTG